MRFTSDYTTTGRVTEHRVNKSGNLWVWVDRKKGGHWRREADGEVAPWSQLERIDDYDALHPVAK